MFLRDGTEQTREVSNLSHRQCAGLQAKVLTTALASASSSCFLSHTTVVWLWGSAQTVWPMDGAVRSEVWGCFEAAAHGFPLHLMLLTPAILKGKVASFACSWVIAFPCHLWSPLMTSWLRLLKISFKMYIHPVYCISCRDECILSVLTSLSNPHDCSWKWVPSADRVEELWKWGKRNQERKGWC